MKLKKYSRKSILKTLAISAAGISGLVLLQKCSFFNQIFKDKKKKSLAMLMDLDKCIGCNACSVACKAENGIALGGFRTRVLEEETGQYPDTKRFFLPIMCNHCKDAPCIPSCPNGAIFQRYDGLVDISKDKCKGYQLCIKACPYGAIYMNPDLEPSRQVANYPARQVTKSDKCNFCQHRIDEGLEPACSNTCPTDARIFGDLKDETSMVYQIVKEESLTGLLEEKGTRPQIYYKGGNKEVFNVERSINKHGE